MSNNRPILTINNHHVADSGTPPWGDISTQNVYVGYFENVFGEQAVYLYSRDTGKATLYMGDAGWDVPHRVKDGKVDDLILNEAERAWLAACWAVTGAARKEKA